MEPQNSRIRDLRRYAKQTSFRIIVGGILAVFMVGIGLIWAFLGPQPAIFGLFCLGAAMAPVILVIISLAIIEWIVRRANRQ